MGLNPEDVNIPSTVVITLPEEATPIGPAAPAPVFGTALSIANEGLPYCMGKLLVELNTIDRTIYNQFIYFDEVLEKSEVYQKINRGGIRLVPNTQPDFLRKPSQYSRLQIPLKGLTSVALQFRDAKYKPLDLMKPYRLTVAVQYLVENKELETLLVEIKERILKDFLGSTAIVADIDIEKYKNNPDYHFHDEYGPYQNIKKL